ncbi:hypothetical protein [uncultured Parvibaculum sp.]|uniref:hypothetical protein n=1 Tax=uncultured Parvibaculum sp. TaxID=291828 RepID=UPI0030D77F3E|tara:strand:+ start:121 stop:759 length:639 start_codon:yes stop_codon:yes gene_type:complete
MNNRLRWRVPGAALIALVLDLLLGPIQSQIWNGTDAPAWIGSLIWPDIARPWVQNILAPVPGPEPYETFGRLTILIYLGNLTAWSPFFAEGENRLLRIAAPFAWAALAIAALADIGSYWVAGLHNEALRFHTFWQVEVPALALCLLALMLAGIARIRTRTGWHLSDILLAATPLTAILATGALQYMPHGPLVAISIGAFILSKTPQVTHPSI